jgi:hypothetical protein
LPARLSALGCVSVPVEVPPPAIGGTRREIESLADTTDLVLLLKRKRAQLAVSGTIFHQ